MIALVAEVGTPPIQFEAVFQSVLVAPIHVPEGGSLFTTPLQVKIRVVFVCGGRG